MAGWKLLDQKPGADLAEAAIIAAIQAPAIEELEQARTVQPGGSEVSSLGT